MRKLRSHSSWRPFGSVATVATIVAVLSVQIPTPIHSAAQPDRLKHGEELIGKPARAHEASGRAVTAAQELYSNRALPRGYVDFAQSTHARSAYDALPYSGNAQSWLESGPFTPNVAQAFRNGSSIPNVTTNSGRITSLAVGPNCNTTTCRLWVGSAGGGVWRTNGALGTHPGWIASSNGLTSNAIGSIIVDPTVPSGNTLYVGTGEPNGSGDSEAGVGLFKSTDGGVNWSLLPGSVAVSQDRSIASIAIDPINSQHIFIGTALARHGLASVQGGRFTPPNAPTLGLYESTDGGASFTLAYSLPGDMVDPTTATGGDYFRGGVSNVQLDRTGLTSSSQPTRVYASFFDYGLYRRSPVDDSGSSSFYPVFNGTGGDSSASRTEFSLAPNGSNLRIYLGDAGTGPADFYRVDNANVGHLSLYDGASNVGWTQLSNSANGTPGFASYDYCSTQCSYDMPVASPPGQPDTVWIGGQFQYGEQRSNGRAIQRSTNAGVGFTDMTVDATNKYGVPMHPDQHAIAFDPQNPNIAFIGSDGGVVRNDGSFVNASNSCSGRGLSGADLTDCTSWLSAIPNAVYSFNDGLRTLQFQSVSVNQKNPAFDVLGGTQDNGTWALNGSPVGTEVIGGDGGQSVIDAGNANIRMHTYYGAQVDVNFNGTNPSTWDWIGDPLYLSPENQSFYIPLIGDPQTSGTMFAGMEHVWRTTDSGGDRSHLDSVCNTNFGSGILSGTCGDWTPIGQNLVDSTFGNDKSGDFVVAVTRASTDTSTLWAATRRGRVFISTNAGAADATVSFNRIDTPNQPTRFVSGIVVDPANPNHAWVSFSGYNAYTPTTPGHVFEVTYDPNTKSASWTNIDHNLGDLPITGIQRDDQTGTLYASTDFGVISLPSTGTPQWSVAANGMPPVAVYGLTVSTSGRLLYAATHGRGVWRLRL